MKKGRLSTAWTSEMGTNLLKANGVNIWTLALRKGRNKPVTEIHLVGNTPKVFAAIDIVGSNRDIDASLRGVFVLSTSHGILEFMAKRRIRKHEIISGIHFDIFSQQDVDSLLCSVVHKIVLNGPRHDSLSILEHTDLAIEERWVIRRSDEEKEVVMG